MATTSPPDLYNHVTLVWGEHTALFICTNLDDVSFMVSESL